MQSLREDVPMTIAQILESHNWRRRKDLVNKVFTPDAVFWHPFFIVHGRHDILGIYQVRACPRSLLVEPLLMPWRIPATGRLADNAVVGCKQRQDQCDLRSRGARLSKQRSGCRSA